MIHYSKINIITEKKDARGEPVPFDFKAVTPFLPFPFGLQIRMSDAFTTLVLVCNEDGFISNTCNVQYARLLIFFNSSKWFCVLNEIASSRLHTNLT